MRKGGLISPKPGTQRSGLCTNTHRCGCKPTLHAVAHAWLSTQQRPEWLRCPFPVGWGCVSRGRTAEDAAQSRAQKQRPQGAVCDVGRVLQGPGILLRRCSL